MHTWPWVPVTEGASAMALAKAVPSSLKRVAGRALLWGRVAAGRRAVGDGAGASASADRYCTAEQMLACSSRASSSRNAYPRASAGRRNGARDPRVTRAHHSPSRVTRVALMCCTAPRGPLSAGPRWHWDSLSCPSPPHPPTSPSCPMSPPHQQSNDPVTPQLPVPQG